MGVNKMNIIRQRIGDSINLKKSLLENEQLIATVIQVVDIIKTSLGNGGKLIICGNGGSASDALHFAGEIVGRFQKERNPWPAVVLNADVATLTAIANDYGYEEAFARQAKAHLTDKDIFVGISTSGNSKNIIKAVDVAKTVGAKSVAFLGKDGGALGRIVDYPIIVQSNNTARVQECHIMLIHIICEIVENLLSEEESVS